jgi:hypothetical protein
MNMEMEKVHSNHICLGSEDKLLSSSRSNLEGGDKCVCTDLGSYDCLYLEEVSLYNWRRYVALTLQSNITHSDVLHHTKTNKGYVIYRVLMAYSTTKLVTLTYLKNCRL